jgi:LmbE family N-acetylglucosaminyl deacetylase
MLVLTVGAAVAFGAAPAPGAGLKVLLVVAHPDDEYAFAATTYRLTRELGAAVDQVVITNGEAGYRYSALAELVYGVRLTDERTARARLPEIRRQETLAAGRILGIRRHYFLGQKDDGFTLSLEDTLRLWDGAAVVKSLETLLRAQHYDFVFTLLPTGETHGHHKAAAVLTLRAVSHLPEDQRPVLLGADPDDAVPSAFTGLAGYPIARPVAARPAFSFDRRAKFGFQNALSYHIVVNWVIAEHKSQGLFQTDCNKRDFETFWTYAASGPHAVERSAELATTLEQRHARAAVFAAKKPPHNRVSQVNYCLPVRAVSAPTGVHSVQETKMSS